MTTRACASSRVSQADQLNFIAPRIGFLSRSARPALCTPGTRTVIYTTIYRTHESRESTSTYVYAHVCVFYTLIMGVCVVYMGVVEMVSLRVCCCRKLLLRRTGSGSSSTTTTASSIHHHSSAHCRLFCCLYCCCCVLAAEAAAAADAVVISVR